MTAAEMRAEIKRLAAAAKAVEILHGPLGRLGEETHQPGV